MSVNINQTGTLRSIPVRPAVTTAVVVYTTPPSSNPYFLGASLVNTTGSAATARVEWFSAKDSLTVTLLNGTVGANTRLIMDDVLVSLRDGDRINIVVGTASAIDATFTIMERIGAQQ